MKRNMALVLLFLSLLTFSVGFSRADIPQNWIRIDKEGLFEQSNVMNEPTKLIVNGSDLYAQAENGFYKFNRSSFDWEKQTIFPEDLSPYRKADLSQFPSGTDVKPLLEFKGQLYAAVSLKDPNRSGVSTSFEIWRSPDFGKNPTSMKWNKVVSGGFGNPLNHKLGLLIEYNNKLVAVTSNTRTDPSASFGDNRYYGPGIQVWESPSGDAGTWYQINQDGFGTESTDIFTGQKFRTNQDFGSGAIYKGNLYIGTLSHFGGQVWKYNGTGLNGWKDVTPETMKSIASRAASLVVYNNSLYLGEGYQTGNIVKYDGTKWEVAVPGRLACEGGFCVFTGSGPFGKTNGAIASLAVAHGKLYASTIRVPLSDGINYPFDQVWGYPYQKAYAYITNAGTHTVSVINTATNKVTTTIPIAYPDGVTVSQDGTKVYVGNNNDGTVYVIDTSTNTIIATVNVGKYPIGVSVTPDGKKVYVANSGNSSVSVIDTVTNTVTAAVNVGKYPWGVAVKPDGTKVYVTNDGSNTVSVIDTSTTKVTATVKVGDQPRGVAVTPEGTKVYVANIGDGTISVIDTATNKVTATVSVQSSPWGVAVNPMGTKAYVTNYGSDSVSVVETNTNTVSAIVNVGKYPIGVSVTPDGKKVYVANSWDSVSVIDTATNKVTATVKVGNTPIAFGQFIIPA